MRRAFLVNSDKCIGCRGCAMACKSFNQLEPERFWRYVYPLDKEIYPHEERAFFSLACNHCENPACLAACPVEAYTKRDDGVVVHNPGALYRMQKLYPHTYINSEYHLFNHKNASQV
jgi:Fe-S-cluster-containing dehydrogenase component